MKTRNRVLLAALSVLACCSAAEARDLPKDAQFTDQFPLAACAVFATHTGGGDGGGAQNRYFPLVIDRVLYLSNANCVAAGDCDELEEVQVTVLDETRVVDGVTTRVVEEREWTDGELEEVSRNFFAECVGTEDIYYFGEEVLDGEGNPLPDGWIAGEGGARAGLFFAGGAFLIGARYFQEVAPDVALDRAEHKADGIEFDANGFSFPDCVLVEDTNALEDPKGKHPDPKVYCPGIGMVMDEELELTNIVLP